MQVKMLAHDSPEVADVRINVFPVATLSNLTGMTMKFGGK